ncbi:MAG: hypothetical protein U1A25_00660 [Candidatus Sungbacteria bacterium]|nr:hypothetical protein [bacterium]MDZ4260155.1 hypothetical protein [Candidatus Sungbacteria bacterium]
MLLFKRRKRHISFISRMAAIAGGLLSLVGYTSYFLSRLLFISTSLMMVGCILLAASAFLINFLQFLEEKKSGNNNEESC